MISCFFRCIRLVTVIGVSAVLLACTENQPASDGLYKAVDELYDAIVEQTVRSQIVAEIDHSRLAAAEGEVMPPARVIIFSNPAVNTPILQLEPRSGLDLPFRVLAFAEGDSPKFTYTTADFLQRRHGLEFGPALQRYQNDLLATVNSLPEDSIAAIDAATVSEGMGIVTLKSDFDYNLTINRLRDAILAESDTVWFGEIDYRKEAATLGIDLPPLKLLLWGAPAPGAKAMRDFPRMGLDAFCQKTLVYEASEGQVLVLFNDMPAFAEIHYGDSALTHRVIAKRMQKTLGSATEKDQ
jgi:uncharacterized protein (DUF302 family)